MSTYLVVKWTHVLSSILLLGTGFGSAYFMFFANRSRDVAAQVVVVRLVVRADWWFTTPTVLIQLPAVVVVTYLMGAKPAFSRWAETALCRRCGRALRRERSREPALAHAARGR